MSTYASDLHDVSLVLHHETKPGYQDEGAVLVSMNGDKQSAVWVPKSQCQIERNGDFITLTAPEWLLISKGLV